ncbi:MAG: hypothetical protein ABI572_11775 [Actinomycetota bacterium]
MADPDPPVEPHSPAAELPPRPDPVVADPADSEAAPEPTSHPRAPFWIGLALLFVISGIAAATVAALAQPDVCDGTTFRSDRFGYCLVVPQGWAADGDGTLGEIPADRIQVPGDVGTVYIQAVPISQGQTLRDFADTIRSLNEQAGYQLEKITQLSVAGVPALRWDFTTGVKDGVRLRMRETVFIDGGNAWRVQTAEDATGFGETTATVDAMLASWVFA